MRLLIVEDDLALSDVLAFTLRRAGFDVTAAYDGLAAVHIWEQERPALVILDLNLPKLDGLAVCRHIRAQDKTPIIMLSVRGGDDAVVVGLELGADDYIVKPFSPSQLVARVRAVLRRAGMMSTPSALMVGTLNLDRSRNEAQRQGQEPVRLTPLEVRLLEALMLNAGQVLSSDTLINATWGVEGGDRAMLKQLVYRLRAKIEPDSSRPTFIETVPGVGYALNVEG
jgi:DNA-binding response OmpR family regulator